jgi:hypothetical protein
MVDRESEAEVRKRYCSVGGREPISIGSRVMTEEGNRVIQEDIIGFRYLETETSIRYHSHRKSQCNLETDTYDFRISNQIEPSSNKTKRLMSGYS